MCDKGKRSEGPFGIGKCLSDTPEVTVARKSSGVKSYIFGCILMILKF